MLTASALSSIVTIWGTGRLLLLGRREDLPQRLRDAHRVLDPRAELEAQVGRELQVLQPPAQLVSDQAGRAAQARQAGAAFLLPAKDAHTDPGQTQVR